MLLRKLPNKLFHEFRFVCHLGVDGFRAVDLMIEQHNYNGHYFLSDITESVLRAIFREGWKPRFRRVSVYRG
jgi:hypothetical protein